MRQEIKERIEKIRNGEVPEGYKKYKEGIMPNKWEAKKLVSMSKITMGQSPNSNSYNKSEDGVPLVQGNNDIENRKTSPKQYTTEITKMCNIGEIILSVRAPVGAVSLSEHNACIGRGVSAIHPNQDNKFLYYFLLSFEKKWIKYEQGSTFKAITSNDLKKLRIPCPESSEQKKIAYILTTWDKAIEMKQELLEKKKQLKKGLMQRLLTGELRLPGFNGKWEEKKLKNIAKIVMGQSPKSANYNKEGNGTPLIQGNADIEDKKTSPRQYTTQVTKKCYPGDIILSVRAPVGLIAESEHEACIGRGVSAIRSDYNQIYLYYYLLLNEKKWQKYAQGSTFKSINSTDISSYKIHIPTDIEEQKAIAEVLSTADKSIELIEKQIENLKLQKKGLMQLLLTGIVRVNDLDIKVN